MRWPKRVKQVTNLQCVAITWQKTPEGMDYVQCSDDAALPYVLSGLLLTVRADLCEAHRKFFEKSGAEVKPFKTGD